MWQTRQSIQNAPIYGNELRMKLGALTLLGVTALLTTQLGAQSHHRYILVVLGTFGGVTSYINPRELKFRTRNQT